MFALDVHYHTPRVFTRTIYDFALRCVAITRAVALIVAWQSRELAQRLNVWCIGYVYESDDAFAMWWEITSVAERKRMHVGRHRRDVNDMKWRTRWAEWNTQAWPTLNTNGYAGDMITDPILTCDEWAEVTARNERVLTHVG